MTPLLLDVHGGPTLIDALGGPTMIDTLGGPTLVATPGPTHVSSPSFRAPTSARLGGTVARLSSTSRSTLTAKAR